MTEQISPDDLASFHRWKNQEAPRRMLNEVVEQKICEVWGIRWDRNGSHWDELKALRTDVQDMRASRQVRNRLMGAAGGAAWERIWTLVGGALGFLGLQWLARKMGVTLPGAAP